MTGNASDAVTQREERIGPRFAELCGRFSLPSENNGRFGINRRRTPSRCGLRVEIGSKRSDGVARRTGVIVPAGENPALLGRQWL